MRPALFAILAAMLAAPASAAAADQTIQAQDATAGAWSPQNVAIDAGDTVTWSFAGTSQAHNVASNSTNWTLTSPIQSSHPPVAYTFNAPGTYSFVCNVHSTTMTGTVTVGNVPPPPPPPLSQQPFPNDQSAPPVVEISDTTRPQLRRVRVGRITHGARVRFRLSEPGRVTIHARRGGHTVKTRSVRLSQAGTGSLALRGLHAGTYRIEVLARDLAGNRSRVTRARLTVR